MKQQQGKVVFRRIGGRVIPIRSKQGGFGWREAVGVGVASDIGGTAYGAKTYKHLTSVGARKADASIVRSAIKSEQVADQARQLFIVKTQFGRKKMAKLGGKFEHWGMGFYVPKKATSIAKNIIDEARVTRRTKIIGSVLKSYLKGAAIGGLAVGGGMAIGGLLRRRK